MSHRNEIMAPLGGDAIASRSTPGLHYDPHRDSSHPSRVGRNFSGGSGYPMPKALDYNATIVDRIDLTPELAIFKVRPDDSLSEVQDLIPGQYVTLGMNNETQPELGSVRRPMSIVSAPQEKDSYEFYIRWVKHPESDNPLTHLMWPAKVGDRMYMRPKPVGKFTIHHTVGDEDPRQIICVAAGTGLAPFISMVRRDHLQDPEADLGRWVILHGASYPADLGYREELEQLQGRGMRYFSTISRPQHAAEWRGNTGRVEDFFLPQRLVELEQALGHTPGGLSSKNSLIYICGLQGTIGETIQRLVCRGFIPENRKIRRSLEAPEDIEPSLFFEQYDNTPVIDTQNDTLMASLKQQLKAALSGDA